MVAGLVFTYPLTEVVRRACLAAAGVVIISALSDLEYGLFGLPHGLHFSGGLALVSLGIGLLLHRFGRRHGEADVGYWLEHQPASGFATIFLVVCVLLLAAHLLLLGSAASASGVDLPLAVEALADVAVMLLAIRALVRSPAPAPGSSGGPEHLPGAATKRLVRPWVGGTTEWPAMAPAGLRPMLLKTAHRLSMRQSDSRDLCLAPTSPLRYNCASSAKAWNTALGK